MLEHDIILYYIQILAFISLSILQSYSEQNKIFTVILSQLTQLIIFSAQFCEDLK